MEEILKEVLIKKIGNKLHDKVLIVENLPSRFLFEQTRKMIQRVDRDGYPDGTMAVDPSGELVWTLKPGIEKSQTGDGGFLFDTMFQESKDRLADIMRYIDMSFSRDMRIPEFVDNAQQIGNAMSGPIMPSQIPRAHLPAPAAPVVTVASGPTITFTSPPLPTAPALPPQGTSTPQGPLGTLPRYPTFAEQKKAILIERARKMREKKQAKLAAAAAAASAVPVTA